MFTCPSLSFEYQAFLFATRRTLEYLAVCVAGFFRRDCHRIKRLDTAIADAEPAALRDKATVRVQLSLSGLGLSTGEYRDTRDRLAHWESVDAGGFGIIVGDDGVSAMLLLGGGEDLNSPELPQEQVGQRLTPALALRLEHVADLCDGLITDLGLMRDR